MKSTLHFGNAFVASRLFLFATLIFFTSESARATTSPYATVQNNVPLNQSTNDSVNGVLPYFSSHTPIEGSLSSLVDATSTNAPTGNVILGPDNTWVGEAWDFGDPGAGFLWKLDRIDVWISAGDNLRKGYRADFSVSNTGNVDDFTVITNSLHWEALTQNSQYNYLRFDFPDQFVAGANTNMDKYPVKGFRYLRLNSRGDNAGTGTDWQTRFAEVDIWVSKITAPSENPTITSVTRNNAGEVNFSWTTISGRSYAVEYKSNLNDANWTNLDTIQADAASESYVDASATGAQRFYRIVLQP